MSTQSLSNPSSWAPLVNPYTGTSEVPDTVSIFFKSGEDIEILDESILNTEGYRITRYFHILPSAIERICAATRAIFANIKGDRDDLWNASKNLVRGTVQLFPIVGGISLYLFDQLKLNFYIHPQIKAALANENEPLLGFAFDGKIITTFTRNQFESFADDGSSRQLDDPLAVFQYGWYDTLEDKLRNHSKETRLQLAVELANRIRQRA